MSINNQKEKHDQQNDQQFIELLVKKKVADSVQYYETCKYKLYQAAISLTALEDIIDRYKQVSEGSVRKVYEDTRKTGGGHFEGFEFELYFFGIPIQFIDAVNKLMSEIIGLLHSFFDAFAQWLNKAFFGQEALSVADVNIKKVVARLHCFEEYHGEFIDELKDITDNEHYIYIKDLNNVLKHRSQIFAHASIDILNIETTVMTPSVDKDGNKYEEKQLLPTLLNCYYYCKKLIIDSRDYFNEFYEKNYNKHVDGRIYNPKIKIVFENENSKYKRRYAYIEENQENAFDEYEVILIKTSHGKIEFENSPYEKIFLVDAEDNRIFGVLETNENNAAFSEGCPVMYRKYTRDNHFEKSMYDDYKEKVVKLYRGGVEFEYR